MEKELNKIVQHQKNKAQVVQAVDRTHKERLTASSVKSAHYLLLHTDPSKPQLTSKGKPQRCGRGKDQCRQAGEEYLPASTEAPEMMNTATLHV